MLCPPDLCSGLPQAEFGIDTASASDLAGRILRFAGGQLSGILRFASLGIVSMLRTSRAVPSDLSRRCRQGLHPLLDRSSADGAVHTNIREIYLIFCMYEEMPLTVEEVTDVIAALQSIPEGYVSAETERLRDLLAAFPEHGQVIVTGAQSNAKAASAFRDVHAALLGLASVLEHLVSTAKLSTSECSKGFAQVKDFYDSAPSEYFDSFMYDAAAEDRLAKAYYALMDNLAYEGIMASLNSIKTHFEERHILQVQLSSSAAAAALAHGASTKAAADNKPDCVGCYRCGLPMRPTAPLPLPCHPHPPPTTLQDPGPLARVATGVGGGVGW